MKPRVLLTRPILPEAMEALRVAAEVELGAASGGLSPAEIRDKAADKDGILCLLADRIGADVFEAAPRLRIVANCAVGYDNIDVAAARARGILVTNTPDVLTEASADLAWGLILATARRIPRAERVLREGRWTGWAIDFGLGVDVAGRTLGIVGMGRIGRAVARRARGFDMRVLYADPSPLSPGDEAALAASRRPLDDLLREADIVTIHAALTPETRGLIGAERLRLMKPSAILVNIARGPIVDEAALAEALASERLWGAGLDVYEREPAVNPRLLELDNVVLLPHIASATREARLKMSMTAVENLLQGLRGEKPKNLVW